jgi:hypothetical protein
MYEADSWEDMTEDAGNTLHIGKFDYTVSFWDKVFPRNVKSALCLVASLFLEQTKVKDEDISFVIPS